MDEWRDWNKDLNIREVKLLRGLRYLRLHVTHTLHAIEVKNAKAGRPSRSAWRRLKNVNAVLSLASPSLEDVEIHVRDLGCYGDDEVILCREAIQRHLSLDLRRAFLG